MCKKSSYNHLSRLSFRFFKEIYMEIINRKNMKHSDKIR